MICVEPDDLDGEHPPEHTHIITKSREERIDNLEEAVRELRERRS